MFSADVIRAVTDGAKAAGLRPAGALALVEVETAGAMFEQDGRTPTFLYERHIAWREAAKVSRMLQSAFAAAGLAIPHWSRATQYKDEGSSARRLGLIARARAIHEETANRSASWGLGQTMGFLYAELGFRSACEMVDHMTGSLSGQVDCFIQELKNKRLIGPLNAGQYATVARGYNGSGYAANHYDTRLADADKRWTRKLAALDAGDTSVMVSPPAGGLSRDEVRDIQKKLRGLGYASVGDPNGGFGVKTVGALSQFQAHEGLPVTGKYDDATRAAMAEAVPIEQPRERQAATAADLAEAGSKTIQTADHISLAGKAKIAIGGLMAGGGAAEHAGGEHVNNLIDTAQDGIDKVNQVKGLWESVHDLAGPLLGHPAIFVAAGVLIVAGIVVVLLARTIKAHRVADHNSGVHAGPEIEG